MTARVPGACTEGVPGNWSEAVGAYLRHQQASGASAFTLQMRRSHLRRLALACQPAGPQQVTLDDLVSWLGNPIWGAEARRAARQTVAGFFRWAERVALIQPDPARYLPAVRVPQGRPRPTPEPLLLEVLAQAEGRVQLMVLLAAFAGLRRAEIAAVHMRDVTDAGLRVTGKGGRVRVVPLHPIVAEELRRCPAGYVFPSSHGGHLSAPHVGKLLSRALGEGWTGHTLRHRFASRAYAGTRDLRAVQELLGHAKPETTARYTEVPNDALREAVWSIR